MTKPYTWWFDVTSHVAEIQRSKGKIFRAGVERAAAIAATEAPTRSDAIDAIESTFSAYQDRFPQWDGSIA